MNKKKEKVIKLLNELVAIFKERNTVRKILQAKDLNTAYEEEKAAMSEQLENFLYEVEDFPKKGSPIYASEVISVDNVVEIYFILLMSGIDDCDLIIDWEKIEEILQDVPEDLQEIAERLNDVLYENGYCFSEYSKEEILKELLL